MKTKSVWNLSLIGSGGDGVMTTANMILKTAAKLGLYGVMTQSYGPQIRGGEAAAHVALSVEPVSTTGRKKDLIVCFRFSDMVRFQKEFSADADTVLVHGEEENQFPDIFTGGIGVKVPVPFTKILEEAHLPEIAKNVFVFGLLVRVVGWSFDQGKESIQEMFSHKSSTVVASNLRAYELGFQYMDRFTLPLKGLIAKKIISRPVVTGNEVCARAAIAAGCRFYAGYPITPSSEILETMMELLPNVGGKLIQAEDEIAAIGMVIGASYGGTPSMTATSGPGLSLMTEMLGLSSMAEIPVVVVDCQRAGPSTGMPSKTEQSDLWHCIYGGHGDFPRAVLAPTDVRNCYQTLFRAFWCAETFQLPVLVLSDANIAQRSEVIDPVDVDSLVQAKRQVAYPQEAYKRFDLCAMTESELCGVNAMALPGTQQTMHSIAGIEHAETGIPSADGDLHEAMNRKRFMKLDALGSATKDWYDCVGDPKAKHGLVTWGSSKGVALEFIANHPDFALFVPEILHPFPIEGLKKFLKGKETVAVLEMNFQGQLFHYLKGIAALDGNALSLRRSGGLPFQTEEITLMLRQGGIL